MKKLITLDYNGFDVSFRKDGFINATAVAKQFNKRPETYLKTEPTQQYIAALAKHLSITLQSVVKENQLVTVQNGGNNRGTWLHPKLAIHFARWLSPEFAVWCDSQIELIMSNGKTWNDTRKDTASAYRVMQQMLLVSRNVRGKSTSHFHFSNEALLCNEILTGERKPLDRDLLSESQLKLLQEIETTNATYIGLGWSLDKRKAKLHTMAASSKYRLSGDTSARRIDA